MFETLTPKDWVIVATIGGAALIGYVTYIAAYVKHKKDKAAAEQSARLEGKSLPSYELEKVDRWFHGYSLALVVEVVLAGVCGWAMVNVVNEVYALNAVTAPYVAFIASVVYGLLIDRFVIHPIADGVFYEKVEQPLIEEFLRPDQGTPQVKDNTERIVELLSELLKK